MPRSAKHAPALARQAWRLMFDFLVRTSPARTVAIARRGLTPNDARALTALDAPGGRSMRSLADEWGCDASYATAVVDRLETMGLAERRASPDDRRVKLVGLTARGVRLRTELLDDFYTPPAELLALDAADLQSLRRIFEKLPQPGAGATGGTRGTDRSRAPATSARAPSTRRS